MDRKEWLEKFLWLCNENRPAREFRRLGIHPTKVKEHIAKIGDYSSELDAIYDYERKVQERKDELERKENERKRLAALEEARKRQESSGEETRSDGQDGVGTTGDLQAMGSREDSGEDG